MLDTLTHGIGQQVALYWHKINQQRVTICNIVIQSMVSTSPNQQCQNVEGNNRTKHYTQNIWHSWNWLALVQLLTALPFTQTFDNELGMIKIHIILIYMNEWTWQQSFMQIFIDFTIFQYHVWCRHTNHPRFAWSVQELARSVQCPGQSMFCSGILMSQIFSNKNSSGDEIANVNFYAVRPEATRICWNNAITPFKVIDLGTNRKFTYDFPLVINTNLPPILHRFRDIAVDRSEIAILGYPSFV